MWKCKTLRYELHRLPKFESPSIIKKALSCSRSHGPTFIGFPKNLKLSDAIMPKVQRWFYVVVLTMSLTFGHESAGWLAQTSREPHRSSGLLHRSSGPARLAHRGASAKVRASRLKSLNSRRVSSGGSAHVGLGT